MKNLKNLILVGSALVVGACSTGTATIIPKPPITSSSVVPIASVGTVAEPVLGTENWNEYVDTNYGYSIKYPKEWKVNLEAKDSRGKTIATFLATSFNNAPHEKMVDIQVSPTVNVSRVDSAEYIKRNGNVIISTSPVVVGGISTDKFTINLNTGYEIEVYVETKAETYVLGLHNTTSSDTSYIDNFNLMLLSFKFTN